MKKAIAAIAITLALAGSACGPSDQQRMVSARKAKADSPECRGAKSNAEKERADAEATNSSIRNSINTKRLELENLQTEDHIAELEGRPIRNRLKESLLEIVIRADESSLEYEAGQPALMDSINHFLIQQACELTDKDLVEGKYGLRPLKYADCLKAAVNNPSIVCKQ